MHQIVHMYVLSSLLIGTNERTFPISFRAVCKGVGRSGLTGQYAQEGGAI